MENLFAVALKFPQSMALYTNMNLKEEIINGVFSHKWPSDEELVEYANAGHGFGGDDGQYGVTYSTDLDEYEKAVEKVDIPSGYLEVYYLDVEIKLTEIEYLSYLKKHLIKSGNQKLVNMLQNV